MKINCDIIQDLMPLYIDGVCSEATTLCVKEHLAECDSCRRLAKLYRENAFLGKTLEEKQLDGLKKIKARLKSQHIFCIVLLVLVMASGIITFFAESENIPSVNTYIMSVICMFAVCFLGRDKLTKMAGKDYIITAISTVLIAYGFCMMYYCAKVLAKGELPFGMGEAQIGKFMRWQWLIIFVLQLAILVYMIIQMFKNNVDCRWAFCINLTGVFMVVDYAMQLQGPLMSVEEFVKTAVVRTVVLLVLGGVGVVVMAAIAGRCKKRAACN